MLSELDVARKYGYVYENILIYLSQRLGFKIDG